eukprot:6175840-Pleurochrysis_carterae.AAC.3
MHSLPACSLKAPPSEQSRRSLAIKTLQSRRCARAHMHECACMRARARARARARTHARTCV